MAEASTVTVKAGDTVSGIALANGTTVSQIRKDNNLKNVNLIFIGDKLKVNEAGKVVNTQSAKVQEENTKPVKKTTNRTAPISKTNQSSSNSNSNSASQVTQPSQSSSSTAQSGYTGSSVTTSNGTLSGSEVQAVANQMASRTGQSASYWKTIMWRESNNQVHAANPSSSARGLFQLLHGGTGSVQDQINNAVSLYNKQGTQAWALTSN